LGSDLYDLAIGVFVSELAREADIELEFLVKVLDDLV
jgi:hypothetical protein